MIGSLGNVEFEVNENSIKTFRDLSFSFNARYTEHDIINSTGLMEFTGYKAQSASLKIVLDASLGLNPREEINTLKEMFYDHSANAFILNGEVQGSSGFWVIESMNENVDIIDNQGEIFKATITLNLKEYIS